jgi:ATP-dependent helicase/DNAse subunit B
MNEDVKIIITNNSNKKYILKKLSSDKKIYNLKFFTFLELKKKLFFDYDVKTLEYVMINYKVSLDIAKMYLDNLYYLKEYKSGKLKFLNELKRELDDKGLLVYDKSFKDYLNSKEIILYDFSYLSKEQKIILNELSNIKEYKSENKKYKPLVFELSNLKEEILYVINRISKLYLDGVSLNKIKIILPENYTNYLKYYSSVFKIPINIKSNHSFYSTLVAQDFLKYYDNYTIRDNIERLKDYSNINDLIEIVNKSVLVEEKRKDFIIHDLKNTKIKTNNYKNAVQVCNLNDYFDSSDYVFLLGFHIGNYPKVFKDDLYLSDNELNTLGLDTSVEKNRLEKSKVMDKLGYIKNLVITCSKSDDKTIFPSLLIEEMNLEVKEIENDASVSFSLLNTKLQYASDLDDLYKFNIVSDNLNLYKNSKLNLNYLSYDNKFSGINEELLKSRIGNELILSYTNLEMYNECAFKYYLSKILKINSFQDSFKMQLGNIAHHILELGLKKDINIAVEIMNFVKMEGYELKAKEYFYLDKLNDELTFILNYLKEQENNSSLNNYLFECNLNVYLDNDKSNVTMSGKIDKVMYTTKDEKEILAVVDYKTGNTSIALDNLKYGLDMQLPIYLYLLKKSDRFKDAVIAGFYIEKIISSVPNIDKSKSLKELKEENLRLQGYSNSSATILELLDKNYTDSKMIKGLRFKNDGNFYNTAKVLDNSEMDELTTIVEDKINECTNNILDGNFVINPKVLKGKNRSCEYCNFKDICFMTKKDEVILGGEDDEFYDGTDRSD